MTTARKVELISGLATVTFSLIFYMTVSQEIVSTRLLKDLISMILFPSTCVAIGSYSHAVEQQSWGRVMLTTGGVILTLTSLMLMSVATSPKLSWLVLVWLSPIVTMIAAYSSKDKRKPR